MCWPSGNGRSAPRFEPAPVSLAQASSEIDVIDADDDEPDPDQASDDAPTSAGATAASPRPSAADRRARQRPIATGVTLPLVQSRADEPPIARTILLTVAGAAVVGAAVGLLVWWMSGTGAAPKSTVATGGMRDTPGLMTGRPAHDADHSDSPGAAMTSPSTGPGLPAASGAHGSPATTSPAGAGHTQATGHPAAAHPAAAHPAAAHPAAGTVRTSPTGGSSHAGSATAGSSHAGSATAGSSHAGSATAGSSHAGSATAGSSHAGATAAGADATPGHSYADLFRDAKRARRHGQNDEALTLIEQALAAHETAPAFALKAEILLATGDKERALAAAQTSTVLSPGYANGWYIKGHVLRALGHIDEAKDAFQRCLDLDPNGPKSDEVYDMLHDM